MIDPSDLPGLIGSQKRFERIYLINQPNVSSDKRLKDNILDVDEKLIDIIGSTVKPKSFTLKDSNKIHFGYIAQDVENALYKYTLSKYGLNKAKEEASKFEVLSKDTEYLSLLYGELAVIIDAYNRRRMDKLEERILTLEKGLR